MADFCITAVRCSDEPRHISVVRVQERTGQTLSRTVRIVQRGFVSDLIRLEKVPFQTATQKRDGSWQSGADVHLVSNTYLATDKNETERDNLGNLPKF